MKSTNWMPPPRPGTPPHRAPLVHSFQAFHAAAQLHQQGRLPEAEQLYRAQLRLTPDHPDTLHSLAVIRAQRGDPDDARRLLRKVIKKQPKSASAHNSLGNVLQAQKRYQEAIAMYRRAIALDPGLAVAINNLGNALRAEGRYPEAIDQYQRAVVLAPGFVEAWRHLTSVLLDADRCEEAIAASNRLLSLLPDDADALFGKGAGFIMLGKLADARACLERAVALAPKKARYYRNLAMIRRFEEGDPFLRIMEDLAQDMTSLSEEDQKELHFSLTKAYMDLNQRERAFRHLRDGNALKRRTINYDERATLSEIERIATIFTPELIAAKTGFGDPSPLPVFILGMPRSGTSLAEQILASHPKVFGAGEISEFKDAVASCCRPHGKSASFPDGVAAWGERELRCIGRKYIESIIPLAPNSQRITDKLPDNFRFIGLIRLALPNAKIIHCRRDPLDTCLSCFTKLFEGALDFSYDLAELGRYYRAYQQLMDHWRQVLPEGTMLELDYEAVVADLEGQARRLLDYCGLEWDPACLAFHQTQRPVRTASAAQVRQPIYRSSVGRWQPYRHLLAPLLEALEMDPADDDALATPG